MRQCGDVVGFLASGGTSSPHERRVVAMPSISGFCSSLIRLAMERTLASVRRPLTMSPMTTACAWWRIMSCKKVTSASL